MATRLKTFGWTTWMVVFVVVLLILVMGMLYVAQ